MTPEPLLNERFRLIRALGSGGAGHTWLAEDTTTGAQVTVKELHDPIDGAEGRLVEREARLLGQIDHPQVPRFVDAFIEEVRLVRRLHLVLEFVEGESLDRELKRRRLSQEEAVAVLEDILGVVAALHALAPPVIHRDLKPSNIIRRPDGSVALIDFGLAIDAIDRTFQHTMAAGTLGYQAPEQIAGDPRPASDVYSVGVLALALLTRAEPHTLLEWQTLRWQGAARHLEPALRAWLQRALDPNPDTRFRDASEALRALQNRAEAVAEPVVAVRAPAAPPTPAPVGRASSPAVGLPTLLMLGASLLGAGIFGYLALLPVAPPQISTAPTRALPIPHEKVSADGLVRRTSAAACRAGVHDACFSGAKELLRGPFGAEPQESDRSLAIELLTLGCMGEHLASCSELGAQLEQHRGSAVAARWWRKACALGDAEACEQAPGLRGESATP